jgi:hypothetical protein
MERGKTLPAAGRSASPSGPKGSQAHGADLLFCAVRAAPLNEVRRGVIRFQRLSGPGPSLPDGPAREVRPCPGSLSVCGARSRGRAEKRPRQPRGHVNSLVLGFPLTSGHTYQWYVEALDDQGDTSPLSNALDFAVAFGSM